MGAPPGAPFFAASRIREPLALCRTRNAECQTRQPHKQEIKPCYSAAASAPLEGRTWRSEGISSRLTSFADNVGRLPDNRCPTLPAMPVDQPWPPQACKVITRYFDDKIHRVAMPPETIGNLIATRTSAPSQQRTTSQSLENVSAGKKNHQKRNILLLVT